MCDFDHFWPHEQPAGDEVVEVVGYSVFVSEFVVVLDHVDDCFDGVAAFYHLEGFDWSDEGDFGGVVAAAEDAKVDELFLAQAQGGEDFFAVDFSGDVVSGEFFDEGVASEDEGIYIFSDDAVDQFVFVEPGALGFCF